MKNVDFYVEERPAKRTFWQWNTAVFHLLLPASAIVLAYLLDSLTPKVLLAPLLCLIFLSVLALNSTPKVVRIWAVVYVVVVFWGLWVHYGPVFTNEAVASIAVRFSSFCISCMLLYLLSKSRQYLIEQKRDMFQLVMTMPVPVIVSDASGAIVLMNESAKSLTGHKEGDPQVASYFYLFSNPSEQGKTIAAYLDLFERPRAQQSETEILIRKLGIKAQARQVAVTMGSRRLLMSVFTTFLFPREGHGDKDRAEKQS